MRKKYSEMIRTVLFMVTAAAVFAVTLITFYMLLQIWRFWNFAVEMVVKIFGAILLK